MFKLTVASTPTRARPEHEAVWCETTATARNARAPVAPPSPGFYRGIVFVEPALAWQLHTEDLLQCLSERLTGIHGARLEDMTFWLLEVMPECLHFEVSGVLSSQRCINH